MRYCKQCKSKLNTRMNIDSGKDINNYHLEFNCLTCNKINKKNEILTESEYVEEIIRGIIKKIENIEKRTVELEKKIG